MPPFMSSKFARELKIWCNSWAGTLAAIRALPETPDRD